IQEKGETQALEKAHRIADIDKKIVVSLRCSYRCRFCVAWFKGIDVSNIVTIDSNTKRGKLFQQ
ncbi:hypothetical protein P7M29_26640, partial [Vibrio parahaemolyticus]|nr:hypothetical protein [Vibrio parahaemolyticus]